MMKKFIDAFQNLKYILRNYASDRTQESQFRRFLQLQIEAHDVHKEVFAKYKNCYRGKPIAVFGSGPTLDKWQGKEDCIQIGVNGTFLSDKVDLDYLFIQDYDAKMLNQLESQNRKPPHVFFGMHYMLPNVKPIPFCELDKFKAERYFFYDHPADPFPFEFTLDIATRPFITYFSTIFVALQFALYTHPQRIYIVGCDCTSGHFDSHKKNIHDKYEGNGDAMVERWRRFKLFADALYPDIEIVSVNPVGLKGLFKDEYNS